MWASYPYNVTHTLKNGRFVNRPYSKSATDYKMAPSLLNHLKRAGTETRPYTNCDKGFVFNPTTKQNKYIFIKNGGKARHFIQLITHCEFRITH